MDVFRTYYGPINKAFAAQGADPEKPASSSRERLALVERSNRSGDDTLVVPSEYLEVAVEKKCSTFPRRWRRVRRSNLARAGRLECDTGTLGPTAQRWRVARARHVIGSGA